jgi:hypothetical protein
MVFPERPQCKGDVAATGRRNVPRADRRAAGPLVVHNVGYAAQCV